MHIDFLETTATNPLFILQIRCYLTTCLLRTICRINLMFKNFNVLHKIPIKKVLVLLSAMIAASYALSASEDHPKNAHTNRYSDGWECNYGYKKFDADCTKIVFPENAYLDYSGSDWKCSRGYKKVGATCTEINVPTNAHLTERRADWECSRGYLKFEDRCVAINVPPDAYLTSNGENWKCDRGFRKVGERCEVIHVPANGYATNEAYGSGWECGRGSCAASRSRRW